MALLNNSCVTALRHLRVSKWAPNGFVGLFVPPCAAPEKAWGGRQNPADCSWGSPCLPRDTSTHTVQACPLDAVLGQWLFSWSGTSCFLSPREHTVLSKPRPRLLGFRSLCVGRVDVPWLQAVPTLGFRVDVLPGLPGFPLLVGKWPLSLRVLRASFQTTQDFHGLTRVKVSPRGRGSAVNTRARSHPGANAPSCPLPISPSFTWRRFLATFPDSAHLYPGVPQRASHHLTWTCWWFLFVLFLVKLRGGVRGVGACGTRKCIDAKGTSHFVGKCTHLCISRSRTRHCPRNFPPGPFQAVPTPVCLLTSGSPNPA